MSNKLYIGIDPGKNGGIAGIYQTHKGGLGVVEHMESSRCPDSPNGMYECLESIIFQAADRYTIEDVELVIEHVHSFPKQGVVSTFSFGQNFGRWEGIISSFELNEYNIVSPQKWMKYYDVPKGLTRKDRKRHLMDIARKLYPDKKITYNVSDAILIANYCRERSKDGTNS